MHRRQITRRSHKINAMLAEFIGRRQRRMLLGETKVQHDCPSSLCQKERISLVGTHQLLGRCSHGLRPVLISKTTQPNDQMSTAPWPLAIPPDTASGDMYIGVPLSVLSDLSGIAVVPDFGFAADAAIAERANSRVRCRSAKTWEAPKSTYLMVPSPSNRISGIQRMSLISLALHRFDSLSGLISW
jgi:hypothetical protein